MITVRSSEQRGKQNIGWLKTQYTFSFADYYDPKYMGYKSLRVINEDFIAPRQGFGLHPHRDMEIITYIIKGEIEHTDDMGNKEVIREGEIQQMSAGTGIYHAEFNPSSEELHLLQIWVLPNKKGVKPQYAKKQILKNKNSLNLIISSEEEKNTLAIHQDAKIYAGIFDKIENITMPTKSGRAYWIQIISGSLVLNNTKLNKGDGAAIENEPQLQFEIQPNTEFLLFDLIS